jgi:hypothetical protein
MRYRETIVMACIIATSALSACAPQLRALPGTDAPEQAVARLDHGYGLLYDLLSDESQVSDLLAIKNATEPTAALLKDISATAARAQETIRAMQSGNPPLSLESTGLPLVEVDARNRIANSQTTGLLLAFGSFELKILLTQRSACEYAWALADSLAAIDPNETRAKALSQIAVEFDDLLARVVKQLSVAPVVAGSSGGVPPADVGPPRAGVDEIARGF